jgi:hypothetical protein
LYALVKRTRTTQKISKISGSRLRIKYKPVLNAPEMPRGALCSKNTAAHQHANVPRGSQQHYRTHEKALSDGNSVLRARSATHDFNAIPPGEGISNATQSKRLVSPSLRLAVEGQNPAADVVWLMPHNDKVHRNGG